MSIGSIVESSGDSYVSRRLLMQLLNFSREDLVLHTNDVLSPEQFARYEASLQRVLVHKEPLAYVLGFETFCGLDFEVSSDVLIPRSETEQLTSLIKDNIVSYWWTKRLIFCDIGTGSWCIWISVAYSLADNISSICLTDISKEALSIAEKNASILIGKKELEKMSFYQANLLDFLSDVDYKWSYVVLAANLPYIPKNYLGVEDDVVRYEPSLALFSGDDGLEHYREILLQIRGLLFDQEYSLYLECIAEQTLWLLTLTSDLLEATCQVHATLHDNIKVVEISNIDNLL